MKSYILAIDQGTTSCRAIVFDKKGKIVGKISKEITQLYPQPGWVEQDPMVIIQSQLEVLRMVVSDNKINPDDIAAIGITNQRETIVVWDRETGKPIYNAINWQCRRTAEYCEDLKKSGLKEKIQQKTGLVIDAYFSGTKIEWVLNNVEGAKQLAHEKRLLLGTIDTWLIWNLTKGKVFATDYTNASRTMLYNIESLKWDEELLHLFGVTEEMLPEVKPSSSFYGNIDASIFGVEIPIMGVAGDQQAALFGQGCFEKGMAKNTYGTGCFLLMNTGKERIVSKNNLLSTLACGPNGTVQYALEGSVFIAGAVLKWMRDDLKLINNVEETEKIARSIENTKGVYFVPAFVGLGAPYWDMYARGAIIGLTQGTGKEHMVRAALEAIAFQTKDVVQAMEHDSDISLKELRVDGGASTNGFLMQFQADILGVSVTRATNFETTAMGAAYLAGIGVEFWQYSDVCNMLEPGATYTSEMYDSDRNQKYKGWKDAVRRCQI